MLKGKLFCFVCFLLLNCYTNVISERVENKIYKKLDAVSACFRRLNGTHQIGCTSKEKGNIGTVHYVEEDSDLDYALSQGPNHPYALLIKSTEFNREKMDRIKKSGRVNGIMIMNPKKESFYPNAFSPDDSCPLGDSGLYREGEFAGCPKVKWNTPGEGLLYQDYDFPIFLLTNLTDINFIIQCFREHNDPKNSSITDKRLCAVQLKDRMDGAKDAQTCIRRTRHQLNLSPDKYCDPLGDLNVYATLKAVNCTVHSKLYPNNSVIFAAARLDSLSMFDNSYPSADSVVTGIVALLAAAEVVGKFRNDFTSDPTYKDLVFVFFQGEAFGYIGSSRMVYDMKAKEDFPEQGCPSNVSLHKIGLENVDKFVEVSQLGYRDEDKLWIHTDPISYGKPAVAEKVNEMINSLKSIGQSVSSLIDSVNISTPLPPASVQSFLKERSDIPAVVITDHKGPYTNKYYNSRFDLAEMIGVDMNGTAQYDYVTEQAENLTRTATMLTQFLYTLVTGKNASENMVADNSTVTHLLYCFLVSPKCELFQSVLAADDAKDLSAEPYPFYVGVDWQTNHVTTLTQSLLARFLGENLTETENLTDSHQCFQKDKVYQYYWMQGPLVNGTRTGSCFRSTTSTSIAKSPVFDLTEDTDSDHYWTDGKYSTWTESSWANDAILVRVFLTPSKQFETTTLAAGVIVLLVSLLVVYFINSRVDVLFSHQGPYRAY